MFTPLKELPEGKNWTLDELNEREVQLLIPVIIFMAIAMVVGTVGNALVLYVNIFVLKMKTSTHRYFIIFLALVDITFCMIGEPFLIVVLTHPYKFTNTIACKSLRAFNYFVALMSILILFVIAFDRYRRICKPYRNQFSIKQIKISVGITAIISFIFSIPCFIMYGKNTVQTGIANITGISCFPDDMHKDTMFPIGYSMFLYSVFIIVTASMCILYTLLWRDVRKHTNSIKIYEVSCINEPNTSSSKEETNSTEILSEKTTTQIRVNLLEDAKNFKDLGIYINKGNKENKLKKVSDTAKTIRVSKMLFVVTVFFVLSFAPFLSLEVLTFLDKEFIETLDNTSTLFYQLFWRTFAINFMVNPFIYGVMDRRFRMECKKFVLRKLN